MDGQETNRVGPVPRSEISNESYAEREDPHGDNENFHDVSRPYFGSREDNSFMNDEKEEDMHDIYRNNIEIPSKSSFAETVHQRHPPRNMNEDAVRHKESNPDLGFGERMQTQGYPSGYQYNDRMNEYQYTPYHEPQEKFNMKGNENEMFNNQTPHKDSTEDNDYEQRSKENTYQNSNIPEQKSYLNDVLHDSIGMKNKGMREYNENEMKDFNKESETEFSEGNIPDYDEQNMMETNDDSMTNFPRIDSEDTSKDNDFYDEESGINDEVDDGGIDGLALLEGEENEGAVLDGEENEEEGSEEEWEEESEESDEDFNDAINALGDLENGDFMNEGEEGEEGVGQDGDENPDPTNNDPDSQPPGDKTEGSAEDPPKKKRKRRKKGEGTDEDGKKPKRKRKKKGEGDADDDGDKKKADKNARRNIRKILTESSLEKETLDAQNAELERQRRLADLKKLQSAQAAVKITPEKETTKEKDSQLKSLLQTAEETAEKETEKMKEEAAKIKEEKKEVKVKTEGNVIDISSGEDDEDCVMVPSEDEEEEDEEMSDDDPAEAEDVNNSGSHINDMYNVPDKDGRVLVNVGHPTADPDIYLSPLVARSIKPHQIGGIRFLYDNLVECINRFKTSNGFGCILAHSMGLGKTIQMVGFTDIFLRHTGAKTVLAIVPINTLANWMAEFNMWVPDEQSCKQNAEKFPPDITPRPYPVYLLNEQYKNTPARAKVVDSWHKTGGVLLIGYEMYRLLSSKKVHLQKSKGRKKSPGSEVIDVEEEDRDKKLLSAVHEALVNPGPDLVVCDEGHRIKNSHAGISMSLKQIKTKRRIVLTGYPLQNNMIEYWCMVDFVRPNFLGTKTEFCNMFERPIMNGQCADSTPQDVRLMRYRAHVLHSLLEGFVQRRGHTVLQAALPPKQEYVFMIRMSPIQKQLYQKFMESITESGLNGWVNNNPLKAFSVCCKIWNHPDILYTILKKSLDDNDLDIETGEPKKKGRGKGKKETPPATPAPPAVESDASNPVPPVPGIPSVVTGNQGPSLPLGKPNEPNITYDWANEIMKDYVPGLLENGGKMVMLFKILQESLAVGDKILVFSQSLFTLNLVEDFLSRQKVPRYDTNEFWCKNKNYFRLDGSTSSQDREKLINQFNVDSHTWLFLLSTRAGSLGVNLVGANRVIVLDASWNPCHDCQAICRVYRFGQIKPSFVYRFVTENTMERKIYDRQVNKQGMADRVVDELNPQSQFKRDQTDKLMAYENKEYDVQDFSNAEEEFFDPVMISTMKDQGHWLTSRPFTHESLLIDRKELKLTMKEKRLAKQSYVMEKRLNVSYSRPSYAAYYPKGQQPYQGVMRGRGMANRPIASVKPILSTPVPMKPKIVAAPQILKPGVSVHQVLTTTDITLPGTNTTTDAGVSGPKKIPAGQQVLVIRTPKGVYIRTPDGKIFAVRSKPQPDSTSPLDTLANTGSTLTNTPTTSNTTITVVRAASNTTTSAASTGSISTPITVIRPGSGVSNSKPLTIIRQGPGPIRTVIPVTIGSKSGGAANATATAQLMSQKVSTMLRGGAQIRIVNPNLLAGGKAATTNATSVGKLIVANTLSFSGGNVVSTTTASKPIATVKTVKSAEKSPTATPMETDEKVKKEGETKKTDSDSSWNLPPIDMQALKIPKQLNEPDVHRNEQNKSDSPGINSSTTTNSKQGRAVPDRMTSGRLTPGSGSMSPTVLPPNREVNSAKISSRPSDIDLHELQLSNNSQAIGNSAQHLFETKNKNSSQATVYPSNTSYNSTGQNFAGSGSQAMMPQQNNNLTHQPTQHGFSSNNAASNNMTSPQMNVATVNPGTNNFTLPHTGIGHGPMSNFMGNHSSFNNYSGMNQYGLGNDARNQGFGFPSAAGQQHQRAYGNSPTDLNTDFNSINNSSSFLSELNFSETDDNFLSQLSAGDDSQSSGNSMRNDSQQSNMFMNNTSFSGGGGNSWMGGTGSMGQGNGSMGSGTGLMGSGTGSLGSGTGSMGPGTGSLGSGTASMGPGTGSMGPGTGSVGSGTGSVGPGSIGTGNGSIGSGNGSMGTGSMSMGDGGSMGMQAGYQSSQQNTNYDMFNSSQQNPSFFPKFGHNQFPVNNAFGNNQSFSQQGGYPSGSMYPMGGMMQPPMYGYPHYPYPYPHMMPPMPYYPMPFQPQYGVQQQQTSNMGNSGIGAQGGGFGLTMGQGDNSYQSNQTSSSN